MSVPNFETLVPIEIRVRNRFMFLFDHTATVSNQIGNLSHARKDHWTWNVVR